MFVPGNNPGMMADAHIYGPDSIMLDLEDSVTMAEKDAARLLVHNALKSIDFGGTEMVVRINPLSTPYGRKDVEAVVKAGVDVMTKSLAVEWGPHGIRLNAIAPGVIQTEGASARLRPGDEDGSQQRLQRQNPMRRLGTPQDIGQLAAFMLAPIPPSSARLAPKAPGFFFV